MMLVIDILGSIDQGARVNLQENWQEEKSVRVLKGSLPLLDLPSINGHGLSSCDLACFLRPRQ